MCLELKCYTHLVSICSNRINLSLRY